MTQNIIDVKSRAAGEQMDANAKTVREPARDVAVCREADVLVVGGGPAGIGAAVAAARNGADTVLIERYNHLGGMLTGGLVVLIPHMSAGTREQEIAGICQEMVDRVDALGGVRRPERKHLGSSDEKMVERLKRYQDFVVAGRVRMTVFVDPELTKCVLNDMVEEAGVHLYLHSWGARAVVEDQAIKGVIFESKSGRQAVLGRIVIDATGDGDIFASAGAPFDAAVAPPPIRSGMVAVVFRLGDVDYIRYTDFINSDRGAWSKLLDEIAKTGGFRLLPLATHRDDQVWVNNWVPNKDCLNVDDLTWTEVNVRRTMLKAHELLRKKMPGFEKSFILDTASQVGTRASRRLLGEYVVTDEDMRTGVTYHDTIAAIPRYTENVSKERPNRCIPYRALVPRKIDNLLAAGRCFSSEIHANDQLNLIPFCIAMGEAAGSAAALALKQGVGPRKVDVKRLQRMLIEQGVWLPPQFRQMEEDHGQQA
jgi:2-polyprenyl-6-methoxyphenol hydroxylase-like FAD-dependent oxidoreductase